MKNEKMWPVAHQRSVLVTDKRWNVYNIIEQYDPAVPDIWVNNNLSEGIC